VVRPHFIVRLLLAENHPDASGDLLLSTTLESTFVTQLDHRNFPRTGLTHLAHSPQPVARALVALDRDAPAELIERLSHDDDIIVRFRMAADERLSEQRLRELFADPQTSQSATANPKLPPDLIDEILTHAGL
jgi:hypothetical protein